ncbi:MAG: ArsR family transcriptional regulator [Proteobacteria bacterium]|nr:ArsR family transcriptional regulator [Pseudomonadota bacterium]
MAYQDFITEDRRLAELRFLAEDNDYSLNDSVMQTALGLIGHNISRDVILADFSFLADLGLIRIEKVLNGQVTVAHLTGRGEDVAKGRTTVPGIKKPRPE